MSDDRHEMAAPMESPPDSESDEVPRTLVEVPPLEKTVFASWDEFHAYLDDYQRRTFQVYSVRTGTPVTTRNKRIRERYARRGEDPPPEEMLPEEMGTYTKAVVCTHHGRPRTRSTGKRRQHSRAINCMAQITLVLRRNYTSGLWLVHVSSHTARHNHALSNGLYRSHPRVRKVTDPSVLHTVNALGKAQVKPSRILEYMRENTDKAVTSRDVHNLLASLRKNPESAPAPSTASAPIASTPSTVAAPVATAPPAPQPTAPVAFSIRRTTPSPPATREKPTQYGKFLASFNIGKEISELMAEMEPDHFARCYSELKMFLHVALSGRVPVVTTREAVEHVQSDVLTDASSTPNPQQPQQPFRLSSANVAAAPTPNGEAAHSLISPQ